MEIHQPIIETYYGPGRLLKVMSMLQSECDRQTDKILAEFRHGCQMAIARSLDRMYLALRASGLWLRYARLQNLIPSFPWIAPRHNLAQSKERKGSNSTIWQP